MNDTTSADSRRDPRLAAIPDVHGHPKGEHRPYAEERPIPYTARMLFLWFYHACLRGSPRFMMVSDHINFLTFEDPAAINLVRRALKLAEAGDLYGAAETAGVDLAHAAVVSEGLRRGMRFSIGAEVDIDPRSRPDAQNIVEALRPDAMIRSVHFLTIEHPEFGPDWQWPFDNPEFLTLFDLIGTEKAWELYQAAVVDAIEKLPGNILGHYYAPAKFGHWPDDAVLETYEDQVLEACAQRGMAVEINTRIFYRSDDEELKRKYRDVNLRFMRKAKEKNVGICVSSDAHSPKDQGNGFEEALAMLDEAEINELIFPISGRLARVALRATKEHLEQKAGRVHAAPQSLPQTTEPAEAVETFEASENEEEAPLPQTDELPIVLTSSIVETTIIVETELSVPPPMQPERPTEKRASREPRKTKPKEGQKPAARKTASPIKQPSRGKKTTEKPGDKKAATVKTSATKKSTARAASASKETTKAKKSPARTASKSAVKKSPAKKVSVKKAPAKKASVKKSPAKKTSPKKKPGKPRR
jgi:HisJ family histidinol phosphate phosphatase